MGGLYIAQTQLNRLIHGTKNNFLQKNIFWNSFDTTLKVFTALKMKNERNYKDVDVRLEARKCNNVKDMN